MSNVHGLFDGRGDDEKNDDNEDDNDDENNRFVGGISSQGGGSGLAVQPNPDLEGGGGGGGGAADGGDILDRVRRRAVAASGGDEEGEGGDGDGGETRRRTITMYRDGFVVDDGPYRRLDDPANAEFLQALARGMTPRELSLDENGQVRRGDVTVGLIDKRTEDYVEVFKSFSGAGNSLGTAAAAQDDEGTATQAEGVIVPTPGPPPALDASRPATQIQIRLAAGRGRLVVRVNTDSPVSVLAQHIGDELSESYVLASGFPPRPLTNLSQSIAEAGLQNAAVTQQLRK